MSDWKLVTLRLSADEEGGYHLPGGSVACFGGQHWLRGGPHIVSVEPAPRLLPTESGSLILARVSCDSGPLLLELFGGLGGEAGIPPIDAWADRGTGDRILAGSIQPDWVQIDPVTLRPVEEDGS